MLSERMSAEKKELDQLWNYFTDLTIIPRGPIDNAIISSKIVEFGQSLKLETFCDKIGNVIIKKPATHKCQNRKTVILQTHLDMIQAKTPESGFDFDKDQIKFYEENGWVTSNGTTLGADNGIGIAAVMTILSSKDLDHPNIEALFTVYEEIGMRGALELDKNCLSGEIILNLDTEDENALIIGSAGARSTLAENTLNVIQPSINERNILVNIFGLQGGHSGLDIDKGRGNAIKLLFDLLSQLIKMLNIKIGFIHGGQARNMIPDDAKCLISINYENEDVLLREVDAFQTRVCHENKSWIQSFKISCSIQTSTSLFLSSKDSLELIGIFSSIFNGAFLYEDYLVKGIAASSNFSNIDMVDGLCSAQFMHRASTEVLLAEVINTVCKPLIDFGFNISHPGEYLSWSPNTSSEILKISKTLYPKYFFRDPIVMSCHAGLECGVLALKLGLEEIISFGPTILGAHTVNERVNINSVMHFFYFLIAILHNTPKKSKISDIYI